MAPSRELVGRTDELYQLIEFITDAPVDVGRTVLIRGEPGIGKSSLLCETISVACSRGIRVLHIVSDELSSRIPYGALARALMESQRTDPDELGSLIVDLVDLLDGTEPSAARSVHAQARKLFSAARDGGPMVVAVDDLPLLDDDSVVLLGDLLRRPERSPLTIIATSRDSAERSSNTVDALLNGLEGDRLLTLLDLGPLGEVPVAALVRAALGALPHARLVEHVISQTGGNPFLVMQTLLDLIETDRLRPDDQGLRLSDEVVPSLSADRRTTILNRVVRVGPSARRLARAVALLGAVPLNQLDLVADLAGLSPSDAKEAFDLLAERGLVERQDDGYRFTHQLIRDALYQELGPAERWHWHKTAACRLSKLPSSPHTQQAVARHVRETAEFGDDMAISVLFDAAERACTLAPHGSLRWYQDALQITPINHPRRDEITARLARALFLVGRPRDAADAGTDALKSMADGPHRLRLILLIVEALAKIGEITEATHLLDAEGIDVISPRLTARAAHVYAVSGRVEDAEFRATQALAALDDLNAYERLGVLVDLLQMCCISGYGRVNHLLADLRTLVHDAPASLRLNAFTTASYTQSMMGDIRGCSEMMARAQQLSNNSGWELYRAELAVAQVQNLYNIGDWDTALSVVEAIAPEIEEGGSRAFVNVLYGLKALIHVNRAEWGPARAALRTANSDGNAVYHAPQVVAHAELLLLTGDPLGSGAELERYLAESPVVGTMRSAMICQLAEIEVDAGRPAAALAHVEHLEALEPANLAYPTLVRTKLARGRATSNPPVLVEAAELADRYELRLLSGRTRLFLGTLDIDSESNLERAIRIFQKLDATPWRRRAAAELRRRGMPVPRHRPASTAFLTETEMQIARLIQLGRPNREIAMTVSLSIKTVEGYLSRIYAKTGCSSRLELARALEDGLLG
jgi:DNA-binding CsgD family transcriptional regulator